MAVGGIMIGIGIFVSSFVDTIFLMYVTYSLIFGLGSSMCYMASKVSSKASIASDFETLLHIKQDENENDAIRNRISNFDKWRIQGGWQRGLEPSLHDRPS